MSLQPLGALLRLTFTDPRAAAARVIALDLPPAILWQAFALVVVVSVLLSELAGLLVAARAEMMGIFAFSPIAAAILQAVLLLVMSQAVHHIGRAFGGQGTFSGALHLVIWLQACLTLVQVVQFLALILLPPLAPLVGVAGLFIFFWLLSSFVMVLHGFESRGKVLLGIVLTFIAVVFALSAIVTVLGISLIPGGPV